MHPIARFCRLVLPLLALAGCQNKIEADLIIRNAKIYTVDKNFTVVQNLVVTNGVFVAVGNDAKTIARYQSQTVLDYKGKYIYPGFMDAHCHFYGYSTMLHEADLTGCRSMDEVLERLKNQSPQNGWIIGRGWDQNLWETKKMPDNTPLNQLFPTTPVLLYRIDGHAVLVNQTALNLAGITAETKLTGGKIYKNPNSLTGILTDKAVDLVTPFVPKPTPAQTALNLQELQQRCFAYGLTSVGDAGLDASTVKLMDSLQQSRALKLRIYAMLNPTAENLETYIKKGPYTAPSLSVRSVKLYADGALGSRGACLLEPYADEAKTYGQINEQPDTLLRWCQLAYQYGYQVNSHCIGDSANRLMLKLYAQVLTEKNDLRWRIEHAQVVNPTDLEWFKKYQIIPSIQTTHCTSDMAWAVDRLGPEREPHAYAWQSLLKQNGWLINGSDFPVEGLNPILGFYAAVTRKNLDGMPEKGYFPQQALSRVQALKAMTIWVAKAQFEEAQKGSIEPGKVADFVVTDHDLITAGADSLPKIKVIETYVGGVKVY